MRRKARPAAIRVRLWDAGAPGAVALALPSRNMRPAAVAFFVFFAIFAAIEWNVVGSLFARRVDDVFDLTFLLFQGFWALGWSVGVVLLAALTVLFAFYSESARIENGRLVHIPRLGLIAIHVHYDLAKVNNVRLESAVASDPDTVQVRFDYEGGSNALGNAMPRSDGQRILDIITGAGRFIPHSIEPVSVPKPRATTQSPPAAKTLPLSSESAVALVLANCVPLVSVLFFGWDLDKLMMLYWLESGVIAFCTVLKIAIVGKLAALVAAPFLIGHFGGFMMGHFLLIYVLFLRGDSGGWNPGAVAELYAIFVPIWTSIAALFISHGVSFFTNFIRGREYDGETVSALIHAPYQRVIVMHLTLIFGGWIILLVGLPTGALVVLLALKTAFDLKAHRREHSVASVA